jgi:predicted glycosyltransferase involved in capsule biosynthesis
MIQLSIIFNVLESYEVVRRHILYFQKMPLPPNVEVVFVDDGSMPSIASYLIEKNTHCTERIRIIETKDYRPWTQGMARNKGASVAKGNYFLFSDIDHIVTKTIIDSCLIFKGDKMEFIRTWGVFDEKGNVDTNIKTLLEYGLPSHLEGRVTKPFNIFLLKREHFETLGGYEERYAGRYGGEDVNFANKYRDFLYSKGKATRAKKGFMMYVYPDPARDVKEVFHSLRRKRKK